MVFYSMKAIRVSCGGNLFCGGEGGGKEEAFYLILPLR
jgi:hypothetical protein